MTGGPTTCGAPTGRGGRCRRELAAGRCPYHGTTVRAVAPAGSAATTGATAAAAVADPFVDVPGHPREQGVTLVEPRRTYASEWHSDVKVTHTGRLSDGARVSLRDDGRYEAGGGLVVMRTFDGPAGPYQRPEELTWDCGPDGDEYIIGITGRPSMASDPWTGSRSTSFTVDADDPDTFDRARAAALCGLIDGLPGDAEPAADVLGRARDHEQSRRADVRRRNDPARTRR